MFIVGIVCFLVLSLLGRYIYTGAAALLSDEDKVQLVDFAVQQRKITIPLTIGVCAVIVLWPAIFPWVYVIALALVAWYQQSKLYSLGFPKKYRTRVLIGLLLIYGAVGIFLLFSFLPALFVTAAIL